MGDVKGSKRQRKKAMPDWDSEIMKRWDQARAYIASGGTASWPRDWFESEIDARDDEIETLRELLAEADRMVVWEAVNMPSDFQERVEAALA